MSCILGLSSIRATILGFNRCKYRIHIKLLHSQNNQKYQKLESRRWFYWIYLRMYCMNVFASRTFQLKYLQIRSEQSFS